MASVKLEHPVKEIHGAFTKKGIINRQKKYRDENGRIIHEGIQEGYAVRNPRDYKKNPPQGAELEHINLFRQACLMTKEILDAEKPEETLVVTVFPPRPKYLISRKRKPSPCSSTTASVIKRNCHLHVAPVPTRKPRLTNPPTPRSVISAWITSYLAQCARTIFSSAPWSINPSKPNKLPNNLLIST